MAFVTLVAQPPTFAPRALGVRVMVYVALVTVSFLRGLLSVVSKGVRL